ncbi:MAG: hypothetical protein N3A60_01455 [Thermanaerothrix sp.]|nr:hypothetical protein [Thermanaerothrix sp.]
MMRTQRNIFVTLVLIGLIACLGIGALATVALITLRAVKTPSILTAESPSQEITRALPTLRPPSRLSTTETTAPTTASLPPDIAAQMDEIEQQVIRIRGLQPQAPLHRELLTTSQLHQKVIDDFLKDYTPAEVEKDLTTLSLFGLLPHNFDLYTLLRDLYTEQIAGFYDDETKTMYVIQDEAFRGPQRSTYAHEYTHALQDQTFDFKGGLKMTDETCEQQSEYCAAVQSLIEGDASLTEQFWLLNAASPEDRQQIQEFYQNYQSPVFDSTPEFLQQDFLFPYRQGLDFVLALYQKGRWAAINAAFEKPPLSTEQILHPEKYPNDVPLEVNLPDLSPILTGYELYDEGEIGEWYLYLILAYAERQEWRLSENTAAQAAAGWGGDVYQVWRNPQSGATLMLVNIRWDSEKDAKEFYDVFQQYGTERWGNPLSTTATETRWQDPTEEQSVLIRDKAQTIWVLGSDANAVKNVLEALQSLIPQP